MMQIPLEQDPRWQRLSARPWRCSGCGLQHIGLFDLVWDQPESWTGQGSRVTNSELCSEKSILSDDFCMIDGEHFFIRCVLRLPIIGGADQRFGYGVWSALSKENFVRYAETFNSGAQGGLGPWFGYLSNRLPGYPDTFLLKCVVRPQDGRARPVLELEPSAHPLSLEQRDGITLDRVLELYAASGHDMHAALDT